ncbi:transposase [Acidiferrobacter sp.]|uniref:transposase n=1 Tax=Acidiferrobacter sp. TaxID=1872107 RepID=UPI00263918C6|nr:transposase [Acidiferrobacter sp.]
MNDTLQVGKTRRTHHQIAYRVVWIPRYRRNVLTGEAGAVCKGPIAESRDQHGFRFLALEADRGHAH